MEKRISEKLRVATLERHTTRYESNIKRMLKDKTTDELWGSN